MKEFNRAETSRVNQTLTDRTLPHTERAARAFTRVELLAACVALLMIALVVAPALANNRADSEQMVCFNNLRLIGRAVNMWAGDFNQQTPWRTRVTDGGLRPTPPATRAGNAWFDFYFLSNQLVTPKILACPSDVGVKEAREFGEFVSISFRSAAVSYGIGLESVGDAPRSWVSGDRNLGGVSPGGICSAQITGNNSINDSSSPLGWTNGAVHGAFGHILLMDGSVEFTSTPRLKALLLSPLSGDSGAVHFLKAR